MLLGENIGSDNDHAEAIAAGGISRGRRWPFDRLNIGAAAAAVL
jgi:hypothetical protein